MQVEQPARDDWTTTTAKNWKNQNCLTKITFWTVFLALCGLVSLFAFSVSNIIESGSQPIIVADLQEDQQPQQQEQQQQDLSGFLGETSSAAPYFGEEDEDEPIGETSSAAPFFGEEDEDEPIGMLQEPDPGMPTEWPELVGRQGEEAKQIIMNQNPSLTTVNIIPEGSPVTADYRTDRVRIFVKPDGTVAYPPMIG